MYVLFAYAFLYIYIYVCVYVYLCMYVYAKGEKKHNYLEYERCYLCVVRRGAYCSHILWRVWEYGTMINSISGFGVLHCLEAHV